MYQGSTTDGRDYEKELEKLKGQFDKYDGCHKHTNLPERVCPHCGRCPVCGHRHYHQPWYQPWYQPLWIC